MTRIEWDGDWPPDLLILVEPYVKRWQNLIPTWCQYVKIRYSPHRIATIEVDMHYTNRWAVLNFTGHFFDMSIDQRNKIVLHEIVHLCMQPLSDAMDTVLESISIETDAMSLAMKIVRDGNEAATEDMANAILNHIHGPKGR
jgi:hypothetical protein